MPKKEIYLPIHVGKALHPELDLGYQGDDTADNISIKNKNYNELTALYWAWKNEDADAIGLVHYRRYLGMRPSKSIEDILTSQQIEQLFSNAEIILPKKRHYWIESNYSHYVHAHPKEPLDLTRKIIAQKYADYVPAFDKTMKQTSAHIFNMFIMKKSDLNLYCEWMFDILSEVEKSLDISNYSNYQKRVYGFISERLLDVWIQTNHKTFVEVPVIYLESQHWVKKIASFVTRKFGGAKQ